ncbi:MAG: hypothetical protein PHT03_02665 [Bacilli bacterium]|nr:hypothetical protein [Bacilli bacterium]MDD4388657.1 hypothetical protein [Bacilli bacterium]
MIAYNETLSTFKYHIENNSIVDKIIERLGHNVSPSEQRSFKYSLGEMYKVLNRTNIPANVRVGIEYKIPITTKRIDFLISGFNENNDNNIIIIELKRWDKVKRTDMPGVILLGNEPKAHPSW